MSIHIRASEGFFSNLKSTVNLQPDGIAKLWEKNECSEAFVGATQNANFKTSCKELVKSPAGISEVAKQMYGKRSDEVQPFLTAFANECTDGSGNAIGKAKFHSNLDNVCKNAAMQNLYKEKAANNVLRRQLAAMRK